MTKPDDPAIRAAHRAGWEAAMNTLNPSQRSPSGMPPTRNGVRAPLPDGVRTPEQLNAAMHDLRGWAGAPSLRQLCTGAPGLAYTSLRTALSQPDRLPKPTLLHAFVKACGAGQDWIWWAKAWDTVRSIERTRELTQGGKP